MEMQHYVLIDVYSGFVWGEVMAESPLKAAEYLDERITPGNTRKYTALNTPDDNSYLVYLAPDGWVPVDNGQNESEITRVYDTCEECAVIGWSESE